MEISEDIQGLETFGDFIFDVSDKILPQIENWQDWSSDEVYPILYIDAIHDFACENGVIQTSPVQHTQLEGNLPNSLLMRQADKRSVPPWRSLCSKATGSISILPVSKRE